MPVSCAFAKLVGVDCVQVQSRGVAQCVQKTLCKNGNSVMSDLSDLSDSPVCGFLDS